MTPAARIQAAIEVLDQIGDGTAAEKALTGWARRARFAGSGDRAAVRDHVFQALRCWASYAALGGADSGRGRMIGALRSEGADPSDVFTGAQYAPAPLDPDELQAGIRPEGADAWDLPEWLAALFVDDLKDSAQDVALALRQRAPIMLRVNLRRGDIAQALASLFEDNIHATAHPIANTSLLVTEGARRIKQSAAYLSGLVELQDGSSQAAMAGLNIHKAARILDYCAGGGGKALALAARSDAAVFAHDIDPARMVDLPARAARAGVDIGALETRALRDEPPFDLVLCDAPCSGSGTWRRTPEAKWRLTPERLDQLTRIQKQVLADAAPLVAQGGQLIYATCSMLTVENDAQIAAFVAANPDWVVRETHSFPVSDGGDGFFVAHLLRDG
ncbi:RsmB/NOP family class I SAM-dependent RNA methyltransferase [Rhodobacteraceae bacterium KMM 6894]|nr:RsmB/NOP family class I SAM-dependent RNA methyltransferase [Rhodobacteraceae bacterium KMM 6894]